MEATKRSDPPGEKEDRTQRPVPVRLWEEVQEVLRKEEQMRLIKPSYEIRWHMPREHALQLIEWAGRKCYKSEEKIDTGSAPRFVRGLLGRKPPHESVIEHVSASVLFIIDRGVSHELVRHRLCAFSQESTRYCNYGGGVTFIIPPWVTIEPGEYDSEYLYHNPDRGWCKEDREWFDSVVEAADSYDTLLSKGWTPQQARSVLPNSLKTEIVMTANLREWRHVFMLRTAKAAHPQMREVMIPLLHDFQQELPEIFEDIHAK